MSVCRNLEKFVIDLLFLMNHDLWIMLVLKNGFYCCKRGVGCQNYGRVHVSFRSVLYLSYYLLYTPQISITVCTAKFLP
jgi:hypothetical protein